MSYEPNSPKPSKDPLNYCNLPLSVEEAHWKTTKYRRSGTLGPEKILEASTSTTFTALHFIITNACAV